MTDCKLFFRRALLIVLSALILCSAFSFIVDPFFHYHMPILPIAPVVNNAVYQNPGIAKNEEYDSVIIGTSLTENFRVDDFKKILGWDAVKLSYSASTAAVWSDTLDIAFENNDVKNVLICLDNHRMYLPADEYHTEMPKYLWDDNPFNDAEYLLNKTVLFKYAAFDLITFRPGKAYDLNDAYTWSKKSFFEEKKSGIDLQRSVTAEYDEALLAERRELIKQNLERNIIPHIKAHPETRFFLVLPPYSVLYWEPLTQSESFEKSELALTEYLIELLIDFENVSLFDFQDMTDVITDFNNYGDINHYLPHINILMTEKLAAGECVLAAENYKQRLRAHYDFIKSYDYDSLYGELGIEKKAAE